MLNTVSWEQAAKSLVSQSFSLSHVLWGDVRNDDQVGSQVGKSAGGLLRWGFGLTHIHFHSQSTCLSAISYLCSLTHSQMVRLIGSPFLTLIIHTNLCHGHDCHDDDDDDGKVTNRPIVPPCTTSISQSLPSPNAVRKTISTLFQCHCRWYQTFDNAIHVLHLEQVGFEVDQYIWSTKKQAINIIPSSSVLRVERESTIWPSQSNSKSR